MAWQTTCPYLRTPMVRHKMGVCICHRNRLWFYPVPLGGSPRGTLAPVFLRFSLIVCLSGWTYLGFLLGNVLSSIGSRKRDYHTARCPVWCSPFQSIFRKRGIPLEDGPSSKAWKSPSFLTAGYFHFPIAVDPDRFEDQAIYLCNHFFDLGYRVP